LIDRSTIPDTAADDVLGLPDRPSVGIWVVFGVVIVGAMGVFAAFWIGTAEAAGQMLGVAGLAVTFSGVVLGVAVALRDGRRDRRRRREALDRLRTVGVEVSAEVTGIIPSTEPALVFEYSVGEGYWRRLDPRDLPAGAPHVGDRIPILVDPDDPGICLRVT
jgi:hypothetical protein